MDISLVAMKKDSNISWIIYAYLFITSLPPKDSDKIIYLDCDAFVLDLKNYGI